MTDQKSNHVTPPTQLTGHEESKREKNGELKMNKATAFAIGKLEVQGIILEYKDTQFYSNKGQTEHCAGESRGANWLCMDPEYVLRTLDEVETGVFLRAVYGEWRMRMAERVIGKWFGEFLLHSRRLTHANHEVCIHV